MIRQIILGVFQFITHTTENQEANNSDCRKDNDAGTKNSTGRCVARDFEKSRTSLNPPSVEMRPSLSSGRWYLVSMVETRGSCEGTARRKDCEGESDTRGARYVMTQSGEGNCVREPISSRRVGVSTSCVVHYPRLSHLGELTPWSPYPDRGWSAELA